MHNLVLPLLALSLAAMNGVNSHATMSFPLSRESQLWPGNNRRFWPIGISSGIASDLRGDKNCLTLKGSFTKTTLTVGQNVLKFEVGNGASHVGPCKAYLVDPSDEAMTNAILIGTKMDCMPQGAQLPVNIPEEIPCDPSQCVVKFVWDATHRIDPIEFFDSCGDVEISGARKVYQPRQNAPTDTSTMQIQEEQIQEEQIKASPKPAEDKASVVTGPEILQINQPAQTTKQAPVSPAATPGACKNGVMVCNGQGYRHCSNGVFFDMPCAPGTTCKAMLGAPDAILCG